MSAFKLNNIRYDRREITSSDLLTLQAEQPLTDEERATVGHAIDALRLTEHVLTLAELGVTSQSPHLNVLAPGLAERVAYLRREQTRSAIPRDVTDPRNIWYSPLKSARCTSRRITTVAISTTGAAAAGAFIFQKPVLLALSSALAFTLPVILSTVHSVLTKRALKEEAKRFTQRGSQVARSRQVSNQQFLMRRATRPLIEAALFGPTKIRRNGSPSYEA